jgi:archaellum component FlaC
MAEDIFNPENATPSSENVYLDEYVGEGKKFKDINELAKAYANADKFIPELKSELQNTREFIADKLEKIAERNQAIPPVPPVETRDSQPAPVAPPKEDGEDLDTRIVRALELRDTQARLQENANIVQDVLVEHLGTVEKAQEAVINRARELGMLPTDMKELAAKSPKAFLTTMGIDPNVKPASSSTPNPSSDVDANRLASMNSIKANTYRYFDELRKSNPSVYWKPQTQTAMHKAAQENPDFFN